MVMHAALREDRINVSEVLSRARGTEDGPTHSGRTRPSSFRRPARSWSGAPDTQSNKYPRITAQVKRGSGRVTATPGHRNTRKPRPTAVEVTESGVEA